jgi:hypothetical protein
MNEPETVFLDMWYLHQLFDYSHYIILRCHGSMEGTHYSDEHFSVVPQWMQMFHIIFKIDLPGRVSRMNRTHSVNMDTMRWACGPSAVIQGRRTDRSSVSCCIQAAVGSFRFLVQYGANHGENIWVRAGHSCSHTKYTIQCHTRPAP